MKSLHEKVTLLITVVILFTFAALPSWAEEKGEKDIFEDDKPNRVRRIELTEEKIEQILDRIRVTEPEEAERLEKLREDDPKKFEAELREMVRMRLREHREERGRDKDRKEHGSRPRRRTKGGVLGPLDMMMPGMTLPGYQRKDIDEYLEWLEENYPEKAAELKKADPKHYSGRLALSIKKYGWIAKTAKENPELAEILKQDQQLKDERDRLIKKIELADAGEKDQLINHLKEVVSQRFDLLVRRKEIALERMLKRLERLKQRVEKSEAEVEKWRQAKETQVSERVKKLIEKTEEFKWE